MRDVSSSVITQGSLLFNVLFVQDVPPQKEMQQSIQARTDEDPDQRITQT